VFVADSLLAVAGYDYLCSELTLAAPATLQEVRSLRDAHGSQVPDDYLAFLASHDGAEGAVGVLAPTAEVGRGAELFPELDHLHGFVIFGSNGAGEVFAFTPEGHAVVVPWIGGEEDAIRQGTFLQFLRRLVEDRLFEPLP
jgi:hypothetical protein